MMDIVGALNHYRKTISADEAAFEVLFFLYKDGETSEENIKISTGIEARELKGTLRELFQANLVQSETPGCFILTSLGEDVCSRFGADEVVVPSLVKELLQEKDRAGLHAWFKWASHVEPESVKIITQSLRNLKVFLSHSNETVARERRGLALTCITPPNSSLRYMIQNLDNSLEWVIHSFSGYGIPADANEVKITLKDFQKVAALYDETDKQLMKACHSTKLSLEFSEEALSHLSFRFFNYIRSDRRDHVVETCVTDMPSVNKRRILAAFLKRGMRELASLSWMPKSSAKDSFGRREKLAGPAVAEKADVEQRGGWPVSSFQFDKYSGNKSETHELAYLISMLEENLRASPAQVHDSESDAAVLDDLKRVRLLLQKVEQRAAGKRGTHRADRDPP